MRLPSADWTTARRATLIWLVVSVPVLSEQITVVQPSVSTDGRLQQRNHTLKPVSRAKTEQETYSFWRVAVKVW